MILGFIVGVILYNVPATPFKSFLVDGLFDAGGKIFVSSLKMLVVPLVLVSLICGTASLADPKKLGRVGLKSIGLYIFTTAVAITIALLVASIVQPGAGFELSSDTTFTASESPAIRDVLIGIVPDNPFKAMVDGNMLQVIFFSILFGLCLAFVKTPQSQKLLDVINAANDVVMKMIMVLMVFAPYGVFCLIAKVFSTQGFSAILGLLTYFALVAGVLVVHWLCVYPLLLKTLSGLSPVIFFKKMRTVFTFAFSTSSSNATLPVTLETAEYDLGVDNSIASFTIPLGATVNMDGTAIMQGIATVFIANAYHIDLTLSNYIMIIVTATLASIGTAGVPGVGLIMLAMVLKQVGLPVEGIGLIIGVDRLLDMIRTTVNVTGDVIVTCIVAKSEKALNVETYNKLN